MFAISSASKCTILTPQSPFLDSTRTGKNWAKVRRRKFSLKATNYGAPLRPFRFCFSAAAGDELPGSFRRKPIKLPAAAEEKEYLLQILVSRDKSDGNAFSNVIAKLVTYAFFSVFLAFSFPIRGLPLLPAMAATEVVSEVDRRSKKSSRKEQELNNNNNSDHEYSHYPKRLLEVVSGLLRTMEEVKNGSNFVSGVEEALKEVKQKKKELQDEIMQGLNAELRVLRGEKWVLMTRSEEILDGVAKEQREVERLRRKLSSGDRAGGVKDKIVKMEENLTNIEREYNEIWERIREIDDQILRRETLALSIGVRELSFIERECEQLVEGFLREVRHSNVQR